MACSVHNLPVCLDRRPACLSAGSNNRALVSQAVLLEHHNRQCDHDTEVLLIAMLRLECFGCCVSWIRVDAHCVCFSEPTYDSLHARLCPPPLSPGTLREQSNIRP